MVDEVRGPLPVKVDSTSNGEFRPVPLAEHVARANGEAELRIGAHAGRVGCAGTQSSSRCGLPLMTKNCP